MRIAIALSGGGSFFFVVKLSRCEPFTGGMEFFNGSTWRYVARTEHSLALVFSRREFRKSQDWRNNDGLLLSLFGLPTASRWLGAILRHAPLSWHSQSSLYIGREASSG